MCTALHWQGLAGRTLDLDRSYGEQVVVTPRRFPLSFRHLPGLPLHLAMVGMAHVSGGVPLYYDAVNEAGLFAAALNFPGCAVYRPADLRQPSLCSFEVIPWLLGQCSSVGQVRQMLTGAQVADTPFSPGLPATPLHWLVADRERSVVLEPLEDGLHIWDDTVGVLSNAPPFPQQLFHLQQFPALSPVPPVRRFPPGDAAPLYSSGMGAMGLPGDLSSASRFVRCAFASLSSPPAGEEEQTIGRFFHIMDTVQQPVGCNRPNGQESMFTRYTCCCTAGGMYCCTTPQSRRISAVALGRADLDAAKPTRFPLPTGQDILVRN